MLAALFVNPGLDVLFPPDPSIELPFRNTWRLSFPEGFDLNITCTF